MIESEIAILNLVSHPHIIELIEVFDFPDEKYLVTELVPGGDLFDAIASDVRYRYVNFVILDVPAGFGNLSSYGAIC